MVSSMSAGVPSAIEIFDGRAVRLAQICLAPSQPLPMHVGAAGPIHVCGDFDYAFRRSGDPEPLDQDDVAAEWSRRGPAALDEIDGEFAFAAWDAGHSTLHLVRDHCGTRPILYAHRPGRWFAFASLPSALRAGGFSDGRRNMDALARWTVREFTQSHETHLTGIYRVLQGERLEVTSAGIARHRYWDPSTEPLRSVPYGDVVKGLNERLDRAVRRRLPREGPVFTHLSGGLDSTAIAAFAARAVADQGRRVTGYSFVPQQIDDLDRIVDERPAVHATAELHGNIDLAEIAAPSIDMLPDAAVDPDLPCLTNPEIEYERVLAHASAAGAGHVLSGFGGDQAASNNGRGAFVELFLRLRWRSLASLLRHPIDGRPAWRMLAFEIAANVIPEAALRLRRRIRDRDRGLAQSLSQFLAPRFARPPERGTRVPRNTHAWRKRLLFNGHLDTIVEELTWRAARHGLGYAYPLLDRELVEYALRIPAEMLVHAGQRRRVFRDAMEGVVPDTARLRDEKLLSDPALIVRLARDRDRLLAQLDTLRSGPAADLFDLDRIAQDIHSLPDPDATVAEIRELTRQGLQYVPRSAYQFVWPYLLALFVDRGPPGRGSDAAGAPPAQHPDQPVN